MSKFFITGVTGVVGSAVLKKVLLTTESPVIVLIRGDNPTERLMKVLLFLKFETDRYLERIEIINSSVEDKHFKMENNQFIEFSKSIYSIFHCAANVDLTQNYQDALSSALTSIDNILSILEHNPACKLEHVSTVGVKGKSTEGLKEERIGDNSLFFNSYEFSKAEVERKLYSAMDKGFKITIHRPSMVVGSQIDGSIIHFQIFYFLLRVVSGELTKGILPALLHHKLDTIPSDFVADLIFASHTRPELIGQFVHSCSGPELSITLGQLSTLMNLEKSKFEIPTLTLRLVPLFIITILSNLMKSIPLNDKWKKRMKLLPQLLEYAGQEQAFLNHDTRIRFPEKVWPIPVSYLPLSIQYYLIYRGKRNVG
jgi:thioester reductase-like protein